MTQPDWQSIRRRASPGSRGRPPGEAVLALNRHVQALEAERAMAFLDDSCRRAELATQVSAANDDAITGLGWRTIAGSVVVWFGLAGLTVWWWVS